MTLTELERADLQKACDDLIIQQQTLLIATVSASGKADISYAPYLREHGGFYIFVSDLARHTRNMFAHPQASLLFIESEANVANLFARKRLTFDCGVREVAQSEPEHERILQAMAEQFGNTVALLRTLPDFHLLCLQPVAGQFIAGFGKAFAIDASGSLQSTHPLGERMQEDKGADA